MTSAYHVGVCVGILKVRVPSSLSLARAQLAYCEMLKAVLADEGKIVDAELLDIETLRSLCELPKLQRLWSVDWVFAHAINLYREKISACDEKAFNDFATKHMKSVGLYMPSDKFIEKCILEHSKQLRPTSWSRLSEAVQQSC